MTIWAIYKIFNFQWNGVETERKSESESNSTIPKFGNRDIPLSDVNPFSQEDQAEGSDGEEQYKYHEVSDIDDHDDDEYNGLTMDEIF